MSRAGPYRFLPLPRGITLAAWQQSRQTTTAPASIASIQRAKSVMRSPAGHNVVGIGVIRQQVSLFTMTDAVDHAVAGKVDDRDLGSLSLLGQPLGEVMCNRVAGGRLIGQELDLVGRKTADLGVAQNVRHRFRVARRVTERPDLLLMQVVADPDQDRWPRRVSSRPSQPPSGN